MERSFAMYAVFADQSTDVSRVGRRSYRPAINSYSAGPKPGSVGRYPSSSSTNTSHASSGRRTRCRPAAGSDAQTRRWVAMARIPPSRSNVVVGAGAVPIPIPYRPTGYGPCHDQPNGQGLTTSSNHQVAPDCLVLLDDLTVSRAILAHRCVPRLPCPRASDSHGAVARR